MGVWTPGPGATAGADTFTGDGAAETADGLNGNDALNGNGGDDHLIGGEGNDVLNGGGGVDTLDGGGGDDVFIQSTDPFVDQISGGSNFSNGDLIDYGFAGEAVVVQLSGYAAAAGVLIASFTGIESARGTSFSDALIGDNGSNTLIALEGADWLVGGDGFDRFVLSVDAGVDHVFGGTASADSGVDTVDYTGAGEGVVVQLAGWATNSTGTVIAYLSGIERAVGTSLDDALIGDAMSNTLEGGPGADWLVGGGDDDTFVQTVDAGHIDRLFGGTAGADAGQDLIDYRNAPVGVTVQLSGWASAGGSTIATFTGIESAVGTAFDDALIGSAVNNSFIGLAGSDWLVGGGGDDTFHMSAAGQGVDTIFGGTPGGADTGFDTLHFTGASAAGEGVIVQLSGYATTNDAARTLMATFTGIESVTGTFFNDALVGNAANNHLNGRGGADWLVGQDGADTFIYWSTGEGAGDTIADFSRVEGDRIDLATIDADATIAGNQAFAFATARTSNLPGEVVAQISANSTVLRFYVDADNVADMVVNVLHDPGLVMSGSDFIL